MGEIASNFDLFYWILRFAQNDFWADFLECFVCYWYFAPTELYVWLKSINCIIFMNGLKPIPIELLISALRISSTLLWVMNFTHRPSDTSLRKEIYFKVNIYFLSLTLWYSFSMILISVSLSSLCLRCITILAVWMAFSTL